MKNRALATLPLFLIATQTLAKPPNLFGKDDRRIISSSEMTSPLNNIVSLSNGCTGSFVGDRLVLTAAHCIYDTDDGYIELPQVYYKRDGDTTEKIYRTQQVWVDHFVKDPSEPNDWAIMLIKEERKGHYFGLKKPTPVNLSINLGGYSEDLNNRMGLHENCTAYFTYKPGMFQHDCDTTRGASGSPIYTCDKQSGFCHVVGVHRGGPRDGDKSAIREKFDSSYANVAVSVSQFYEVLVKLKNKYDLPEE